VLVHRTQVYSDQIRSDHRRNAVDGDRVEDKTAELLWTIMDDRFGACETMSLVLFSCFDIVWDAITSVVDLDNCCCKVDGCMVACAKLETMETAR
jgi:hypothetical protein